MIYDYIEKLSDEGVKILLKNKLLYYSIEQRVGKTVLAYETCKKAGLKNILMVTEFKKKRDGGHVKEYTDFGYDKYFDITVEHYNYLQLRKLINNKFDCIILDEAQHIGAFPKPSAGAKEIHEIAHNNKAMIIYLSGTPTPESFSQQYHQFWVSAFSPFKAWPNFYKWAKSGFVEIKQVWRNGFRVPDYSDADKTLIDNYTKHLFIDYTQKEAGFKIGKLKDEIIHIKPNSDKLYNLINILLEDKFYSFKNGINFIACESAVSLQQKVHQIFSGTIITEKEIISNNERTIVKDYAVLDPFKAEYIYNTYYKKYKIAIFYLYVSEGALLRKFFKGCYTDNEHEFNNSDHSKVFIGQIQSSARAINLSAADILIMYNIHFSYELYSQVRQRGSAKNKKTKTKIHWIFTENGIEDNIYERVINKQSYTNSYFKKDYLT